MTSNLQHSSTTDIAIVGGGMVGATLALLLAAQRRDWRIAVIEAFPFPAAGMALYQPSFDARSSAIAAGSQRILADIGLWPTLAQHATAIERVHVSDRGHFGGTLIDCRDYALPALGYVVENAWLGAVLLEALRRQTNIHCLAPAQVTALVPRAQGAGLLVEEAGDRFELHCQLAVIAEGVDSPLRKSLGINVAATDYRQTAIVTNVAFDRAHGGTAYERFTDEGPLALLPLGESAEGRRSALIWTQPQERADELLGLEDEAFLHRLQQRFGYRLGHFIRVGKRHRYSLQLLVAKEQVRSSLVLMGNAAHFLHPVAGQGFNLALRDCTALAETLAGARERGEALGRLAVLEAYRERQALDQALTTHFSDSVTQLFSTSNRVAAVLRNLGFLGLDALAPAKDFLARQTMGRAGRQARIGSALP